MDSVARFFFPANRIRINVLLLFVIYYNLSSSLFVSTKEDNKKYFFMGEEEKTCMVHQIYKLTRGLHIRLVYMGILICNIMKTFHATQLSYQMVTWCPFEWTGHGSSGINNFACSFSFSFIHHTKISPSYGMFFILRFFGALS